MTAGWWWFVGFLSGLVAAVFAVIIVLAVVLW